MKTVDCSTLPTRVQEILHKYRIICNREEGGKKVTVFTEVNLKKSRNAENHVLGKGPLLAPDVVDRFVKADTTPDCRWLDWMLFHGGGGAEGKRRSEQALAETKEQFPDERIRGYRDSRGIYHDPVSKEEAEREWAEAEPKFREVLEIADQDIVEKLHVFGFFRNWPGFNKVYETVTEAVKKFLSLESKIQEMNEFMHRQGTLDKVISLFPDDYTTVEGLLQASSRVERFFASRAARQDIRVEQIYSDDMLRVLAPLTYAASVYYGWDGWSFSNREDFENKLEGTGSSWNDAWKSTTGKEATVPIFIQFQIPMPAWVSYDKTFRRHTFQNLAIMLAAAPASATNRLLKSSVLDEGGRSHQSIHSVIGAIEAEVTRNDDPAASEYPVHAGPRVFTTTQEAQAVTAHLMHVLEKHVAPWARTFDHKRIVVEYLANIDS